MTKLERKRRCAKTINTTSFVVGFIAVALLWWLFSVDYLVEQEFLLACSTILFFVVSVCLLSALVTGEAWTKGMVFRIEESAIGYYLTLLSYFLFFVLSVFGVFHYW